MEMDFIGSEMLDEEAFEVQENHDFPLPEADGERCGICMDIIIDRGLLDCCQHWFCFGCIDDWATITNLCPLCQNVFQSITCVPVYDTIGSSTADDDSFSGDDGWSVEGNSDTLSLPSYYIDENAVTCLDGVDCRVRNGSATIGDDCNLETSIACDSCDVWYHAACVGFDPEGSSEDTWICPRCSKSDTTWMQRPNGNCVADTVHGTCLNEAALCGKMSVSVADDGETALVVSMIEAEGPRESLYTASNTDEDFGLDRCNNQGNLTAEKQTDFCQKSKEKESGLSSLNDASLNHESCSYMVQTSSNETKNEGSSSSGAGTSLTRLSMELHELNNKSGRGLRADLLIDETVRCNDNKETVGNSGSKRKHSECSDNSLKTRDGGHNYKNVDEPLKKKITGSKELQPASGDQVSALHSGNSLNCPPTVAITRDLNCNQSSRKEDVVCDVMSIVQGTSRRPLGRRDSQMPGKPVKETENKVGLRVKKILRRASDDKDSSFVVQKLRKEIRDAVRNKSSDFGEHLFDPKLLTAFRAAIAGSSTEPIRNLPPASIRMKKSLMQKNKVRENLTKKIYADSNGRRKRAWDRDCEVEFWKHRCMRTTKPEKIATLNSVLNLLKKDAEGIGKDVAFGSQEKNPILSRLYLADTSVFPRKDSIKPLSALATTSNSELSGALPSVGESQQSSDGQSSKGREVNKMPTKNKIISADDKDVKDKVLNSKNINLSSRIHPEKGLRGPQASPLGGPKSNLSMETVTQSDDRKTDKRKWAMEVLARKMAIGGKSGEQEKQEDNADLKGNFPLLAQLPRDMRPELAHSLHKKIPVSTRQKQLYRLTEHFLKKLNLSEMRRMAETELAVADAINIEKEVANRSNSKQGYLNLCSHEILRRSDEINSLTSKEPNSEAESTKSAVSEQPCEVTTDPDALEALRKAGLLSDSPPNTPNQLTAEADESKFQREAANSVFEIGVNADVDIYGDFEYDLEDEDYIGATSVKFPIQPVEDGESKLKVVLTTFRCNELINNGNSSCAQKFVKMEESDVPPALQDNPSDAGIISSREEAHVTEAFSREESEDPSLVECEALYGPDKEPLIEKLPLEILCLQPDSEVPAENVQNVPSPGRAEGKDVLASHDLCNGYTSAGHLQASERVSGKVKASLDSSKHHDGSSVSKKVEAYIKEHIRPLWKSGIITAEQYRWAVAKTTDKVMKFHSNSKNANFLIKEGEKVKKLAEKYVEAAQQKGDK